MNTGDIAEIADRAKQYPKMDREAVEFLISSYQKINDRNKELEAQVAGLRQFVKSYVSLLIVGQGNVWPTKFNASEIPNCEKALDNTKAAAEERDRSLRADVWREVLNGHKTMAPEDFWDMVEAKAKGGK
jgi:hypothetical protein